MHGCASYSSRPTGSDFTKQRRRQVDGVIERPLFCCPVLWSRTPAARLMQAGRHPGGEIRDAYYTYDCKYAKLKTGGAYYTQVCIISETLRYAYMTL